MIRSTHPATRLAIGAMAVTFTSATIRTDRVTTGEQRLFTAVNDLPDRLYAPLWAVMQLGTLGAAPVAAAAARLKGDRRLAARLLVAGSASWALSKAFKRIVGRPRPTALVAGTRVRGPEATGLGYLSGHAGVAMSLGVAVLPKVGPTGRLAIRIAIPTVGLARVYVGAHLPLDVAGGAALGLLVEAATELYQQRGASHCVRAIRGSVVP